MVSALPRLALLGLVVACTNGSTTDTVTDTTTDTSSVTDADSGTDTGTKTTTLPPATLFWTESPADCKSTVIRSMAPEASVPVDILTLAGPDLVHDLAVDGAAQTIYFTFGTSSANATEEVRRVQVDGTKSAPFALLPDTGRGIALDAGARNLYWVMDDNTINVASLDGGTPQAVFTQSKKTIANMSGLALDLAAGKMYWSDVQFPPQIRWANLDGSKPAPLYVVTGTGKEPGVNDLEVDAAGGRLYWVESAYEKKTDKELLSIRSANLDGSDDQTLVDQSGGRLNDLAVDGAAGVLYWAETVYCGKTGSRIMRANLDGSGATPVISGLGVISGLELVR